MWEIRSGKAWSTSKKGINPMQRDGHLMYENIGTLIGDGFGLWRKNLNLCIPFLLVFAFSLLAIVPLIAAMAIIFGSTPELISVSSPQEALSKMAAYLPGLALAFLISVLLISMVNSFFAAGGIAMAEQAIREGKTNTSVMWSAGKKNFWNMFVASILIALIMMAGFVFLLPGILSIPPSMWTSLSENQPAIGLLAFGAIMLILYLFIISLVLAMSPYALVVDGSGPFTAIKASITFVSYNKFDVFMMWIIVVAISLGLQMTGSSAAATGAEYFQVGWSLFTTVVNLLVLAPLSAVWWTRLYMSRTGKKLYQEDIDANFDES
jgi:hypothetical protein